MLRYQTIPVTPFQQNCSIVWCDASHRAAIIDPGGDLDVLIAATEKLGVTLEQIWITHGHVDHAAATAELAQRLQLPISGPHPDDQFWIDGLPQAAASYGFPAARPFVPTRWLFDGDTVALGEKIYRGGIASKQVPACAGCHNPSGAGIPAQYPRIGGQHADYTELQLTTFRSGARANSSQMMAIAARMSDKEIKAVSDYIAGLR